MDMKKILAAVDGVSSKPVQGANDMKKFVSIVTESNNRLSMAEQMVVQEYTATETKPVYTPVKESSFINKYIDQVIAESEEQAAAKKESVKAVAQKIATKIKESGYRSRRDAYQRDYDSSISGMDKKDSYAYQQDGGANDEGWDEEPVRQTWYIRANGKVIKKDGVAFNFSSKETARKAAMTMMSKPFNAGKKFVLTTNPTDEKPAEEMMAPPSSPNFSTDGGHHTLESSKDDSDDNDPPFDGPYTKTKGTVTDKSGAKHTDRSKVKHLAKQGMKAAEKKEKKVEEGDEKPFQIKSSR